MGAAAPQAISKEAIHYGSMKVSGSLCTSDPHQMACLQKRGSIAGIMSDISLNMGGYVLLTLTMLFNLPKLRAKLEALPCSEMASNGFGKLFCEYTEVYVHCWPMMTFSITWLIVGRDLIQKRFYYHVLIEGGLIRYRVGNIFADFLILISVLCFLHVCGYAGFLFLTLFFDGVDTRRAVWKTAEALYKAAANPNSPNSGIVPGDGVSKADPEGFALLVFVMVCMLVPGIFYLVFLFRTYAIETTLVPLSEYISDLKTERTNEELSKLAIMEESAVKALLEKDTKAILLSEEREDGDRYRELVRRYEAEGWRHWCPDVNTHLSADDGSCPVTARLSEALQAKDQEKTNESDSAADEAERVLTSRIDRDKASKARWQQVQLLDSLWPACFLLTHQNLFYHSSPGDITRTISNFGSNRSFGQGEHTKLHYFAVFWHLFLAVSLVLGIAFLLIPLQFLTKVSARFMSGDLTEGMAPLLATILNLGIAVMILHRLSKATPLWSKVKQFGPRSSSGIYQSDGDSKSELKP